MASDQVTITATPAPAGNDFAGLCAMIIGGDSLSASQNEFMGTTNDAQALQVCFSHRMLAVSMRRSASS